MNNMLKPEQLKHGWRDVPSSPNSGYGAIETIGAGGGRARYMKFLNLKKWTNQIVY